MSEQLINLSNIWYKEVYTKLDRILDLEYLLHHVYYRKCKKPGEPMPPEGYVERVIRAA